MCVLIVFFGFFGFVLYTDVLQYTPAPVNVKCTILDATNIH